MFSNIVGSSVGLQHAGEKFQRMGGDAVSETKEVVGLMEEDLFMLNWVNQCANILCMFLFMWGDDGVDHNTQDLAKMSHWQLVELCVQIQ